MSLRSLNIGATGIDNPTRGLDVVANNLANLQTPGFKNARATFQDMVYAKLGSSSVGSGSTLAGTSSDFSPGGLEQTGRDLDIAIDGPGFLRVADASNNILYTRAGNLSRNARGELTTPGGYRLVPSVNIPADADTISIASDGTVSVTTSNGSQSVGTMDLVSFANPEGLAGIGENLFVATAASGEPVSLTSGSIRQGYLESSNVNLVDEVTTLVRLQQAFQINAQVIQAANERLEMLRELTR